MPYKDPIKAKEYNKQYREARVEERKEYQKNWWRNKADRLGIEPKEKKATFLNTLLNTAKYRAKKKGLEFSITLDDLEVPEYCPVFKEIKLESTIGTGKRSNSTPSLDRLDNSKGYTKENSRIISFKANQYKGNMSIKEVESLLNYMKGK